MTETMIKKLRDAYSTLERVNPESTSFKKLRAFVEEQSKGTLQQLADADINFVSYIAEFKLESMMTPSELGALRRSQGLAGVPGDVNNY